MRVRSAMRNERKLFHCHREEFNRLLAGRRARAAKAAQLFYFLNRTGCNALCWFNRSGACNEQERLVRWLADHPGPVVLSNQATPRILELYANMGIALRILHAPRAIACTRDRAHVREVLATRDLPPD